MSRTTLDTQNMAVFCDFENVALGVREARYDQFDINKVLERLLLKGSIVVKKAYCDWARYKDFKAGMHQASFELIEIPHVRMSGKNSADIRLVVDALDLCYTKAHVDCFVIVSGDSDFSPLVSKLRENNKTVIGCGVKNSTSDLLIANCDEFIYYDDLVRGETRKRPPSRSRTAGATREGSAREGGVREGAGREGAGREGGAREGGAREGGAREGTGREPAEAALLAPAVATNGRAAGAGRAAAGAKAAARKAPKAAAAGGRARKGRKAGDAGDAGEMADDAVPADAADEMTIDIVDWPDDDLDAPASAAEATSASDWPAHWSSASADEPSDGSATERGGSDRDEASAGGEGGERRGETAAEAADRTQRGLDLILETLDALLAERGEDERIWGSMIKQTLKRRNPGFNELYYGYKSFNRMLEEARDRQMIALEDDGKSGGYVVRAV